MSRLAVTEVFGQMSTLIIDLLLLMVGSAKPAQFIGLHLQELRVYCHVHSKQSDSLTLNVLLAPDKHIKHKTQIEKKTINTIRQWVQF